jgi:hypothetical protein
MLVERDLETAVRTSENVKRPYVIIAMRRELIAELLSAPLLSFSGPNADGRGAADVPRCPRSYAHPVGAQSFRAFELPSPSLPGPELAPPHFRRRRSVENGSGAREKMRLQGRALPRQRERDTHTLRERCSFSGDYRGGGPYFNEGQLL